MKTFKDTEDRTWEVALNVTAVKRVRDLCGPEADLLDLGGDGEKSLFVRLMSDPVLLCDVIYAVCKPQADRISITDEQFGEAMAGDTIDNATQALLGEIVDFTPSPRDRARVKLALTKTNAMVDKAQDLLDTRAEREIDKALDTFLADIQSGEASTNSPESSESIPAP